METDIMVYCIIEGKRSKNIFIMPLYKGITVIGDDVTLDDGRDGERGEIKYIFSDEGSKKLFALATPLNALNENQFSSLIADLFCEMVKAAEAIRLAQ